MSNNDAVTLNPRVMPNLNKVINFCSVAYDGILKNALVNRRMCAVFGNARNDARPICGSLRWPREPITGP